MWEIIGRTIGFVNWLLVEVKDKKALSTLAHRRHIKFAAAVVKQVWLALDKWGTVLKEGKLDDKTQAPHEQ